MTFTTTDATLAPLLDTLRNLRKAKGMSARAVDEAAGLTDGYTEKMESGIRRPTLETLRIWAEALGARLLIVPPLPLQEVDAWRGRRMSQPLSVQAQRAPDRRPRAA